MLHIMTKQDIQKIIDSFLEGKGPKASVESVSDGIAKISVVGKCGGGCGCRTTATMNGRTRLGARRTSRRTSCTCGAGTHGTTGPTRA